MENLNKLFGQPNKILNFPYEFLDNFYKYE